MQKQQQHHPMLKLILLLYVLQVHKAIAFQASPHPHSIRATSRSVQLWYRKPGSRDNDTSTNNNNIGILEDIVLSSSNWNNNIHNISSSSSSSSSSTSESESFGSMLMKLQNQTNNLLYLTPDEAITLDANTIQELTTSENDSPVANDENAQKKTLLDIEEEKQRQRKQQQDYEKNYNKSSKTTKKSKPKTKTNIDPEIAKELDESITYFKNQSPEALKKSIISILDMPEQLTIETTRSSQQTSTTTTTTDTVIEQPLSMPEHYRDRIGRDISHLAVSIASCVEDVNQWKIFCNENGGLMPLLSCIREGAKFIVLQKQNILKKQLKEEVGEVLEEDIHAFFMNEQRHEESFMASCRACRALRDICALSPDVSAVITDGILRANVAWMSSSNSTEGQQQGGIFADFMTIIQYANDYSIETTLSSSNMNNNNYFYSENSSKKSRIQKIFNNKNTVGSSTSSNSNGSSNIGGESIFKRARIRRDARLRCKLYVTQLLLAMTIASDHAVQAIRETNGLTETILKCSSYTKSEQTRRWLRYPGEMIKWVWRRYKKRKEYKKMRTTTVNGSSSNSSSSSISSRLFRWKRNHISDSPAPSVSSPNVETASVDTKSSSTTTTTTSNQNDNSRRPFVEAAAVGTDLDGYVRRTSNQILAAIGYNQWVPKIPGQKGLRILCMDGGGSRGMTAVSLVREMVDAMGGVEVSDSFDIIAGTSTGGIISFLVGLRRETSAKAVERYNALIKQIFVKSPLSASLMLFTTATYDESHFMGVLSDILGDQTMLDSRADPAVPLVFAVASKMSSTPTHLALFRNYNYAGGELRDPFTIDPDQARIDLGLPLELEDEFIRSHSYFSKARTSSKKSDGSRHPGSFRVLQRYALRASTAAPTVFKPVMMGGEMYCDGGIVASNPAAVAIHEARRIFPDVPIELVVSIGTGAFLEQKNSPRIGWDGIIGQIVDSATDGEQIHHVLEDILGEGGTLAARRSPTTRLQSRHVSETKYFRFNPTIGLPDEFPIDVTDPVKLKKLQQLSKEYLHEPEQQDKLEEIRDILLGRQGWRKWLPIT